MVYAQVEMCTNGKWDAFEGAVDCGFFCNRKCNAGQVSLFVSGQPGTPSSHPVANISACICWQLGLLRSQQLSGWLQLYCLVCHRHLAHAFYILERATANCLPGFVHVEHARFLIVHAAAFV